MEENTILCEDLLLCDRSIQTRNAHRLIRTVYHVREHTVTHTVRGARHRLFGLLPPADLPKTEEVIRLPDTVRTKQDLLRFLRNEKPRWL